MLFLYLLLINICNGEWTQDINVEDCILDNSYINSWDGDGDAYKDNYYIQRQISTHSNSAEDRKFKYKYCRPDTDNTLNTKSTVIRDQWVDGATTEWTVYDLSLIHI